MYLSEHTTERLLMRPLTESDINAWEVFIADEEFRKFYFFDLSLSLTELSKQWIDRQLKRYADNGLGLLALTDKDNGAFIGQAGLITQDVEDVPMLEIGYHILPEYRGRGLATEAAVYFKEFAFKNNIADSIVSLIHIDNIRSQRVAEKNGMVRDKEIAYRGLPIYVYRTNKA